MASQQSSLVDTKLSLHLIQRNYSIAKRAFLSTENHGCYEVISVDKSVSQLRYFPRLAYFHFTKVNWNKHSKRQRRNTSREAFPFRTCFPIIFYERHWRKLSTSYTVFRFLRMYFLFPVFLFNERAHFRI